MLRSVFGPWILENTWGILFLVMRRCYSKNLVGGFESKLKIWVNQSWGRFCVPAQNRWVADSPPAERGRSAFRVADGPQVLDFSDAC